MTKKTSIRSINSSYLSNVASSTSDEESPAFAGLSGKGQISAKSSSRRTLKRRTRVSRDNDSGSDSGTGTDIEQDVAQSSRIGWIHPPNIASHELQKDVSENILLKRGNMCDQILHPFILDYYEQKMLYETTEDNGRKIRRFAAKYSFHNVEEGSSLLETSGNIYRLINRNFKARSKRILTEVGDHGIVAVLSRYSSPNYEDKKNSYLICQYQSDPVEVEECKHYIQVLLFGQNNIKIVENLNELDELLETTAKTLKGFVNRENSCFDCEMDNLKNITLKIRWKNRVCNHKLDLWDDGTIELVKESGNFRNFENLSLNEGKLSDIFLDGAVKISRTLFKEEFKFRARIARFIDFDQIVEYLHSHQNMVCMLNICLYLLDTDFFADNTGTYH